MGITSPGLNALAATLMPNTGVGEMLAKGLGHLVTDTGEAYGDVAYYYLHPKEAHAAEKLATRYVDAVWGTFDIANMFVDAANLAKGAASGTTTAARVGGEGSALAGDASVGARRATSTAGGAARAPTVPDLPAGAGGKWKTIGEVRDPSVPAQSTPNACGPACGEMVLGDRGVRALESEVTIAAGHELTNETSLAEALNELDTTRGTAKWQGGFIPENQRALLMKRGSWIAMFWEQGRKTGHWVVVDGLDSAGNYLIRDPSGGVRYAMEPHVFKNTWNGIAVFR